MLIQELLIHHMYGLLEILILIAFIQTGVLMLMEG